MQIPGLSHTISLSLSNNQAGGTVATGSGLQQQIQAAAAAGGQQTVVLTNQGGGQALPFGK